MLFKIDFFILSSIFCNGAIKITSDSHHHHHFVPFIFVEEIDFNVDTHTHRHAYLHIYISDIIFDLFISNYANILEEHHQFAICLNEAGTSQHLPRTFHIHSNSFSSYIMPEGINHFLLELLKHGHTNSYSNSNIESSCFFSLSLQPKLIAFVK